MKKLFLLSIFALSTLAVFSQAGSQAVSGIKFRVNDTTSYQAAADIGHSQGYFDMYFNNQATTPHFDIWNGVSYTHIFDFNAGGGGSFPLTDGNYTTANGTAVDIGGAGTSNPTFTGNYAWTWASNGSRMGNYRVWSNGTIGLDAATSSFLQVGSNTISVEADQAEINIGSSRIRAKADSLMFHTNSQYRLKIDTDGSWDMGGTTPGTLGQVLTSAGSGSAPTWEDPAGGGGKLPSLDKTASFTAAIVEAGTYHYNITPSSATTITFPSLTGQEGLQWAFWKNVDADAVVFDFGAETYNGATVLPDTSWVYVNWSDGRFKVAGTNPATGGGSSGTVTTVTGSDPIVITSTPTTTPNVTITQSTTSTDGYLSQTDWDTFNGKQNSITFGTGVLTSLGVNIGSAGAPILFNGAAGTPSSINLSNATGFERILQVAISDQTLPLTTGTGKITFRAPRGMTIVEVRASLTVAQSSGSIFTLDINEGGTTILSTKLTIDNTEKTSTTAATPAVISDSSITDDAEITIDVDQVGNGTAVGCIITIKYQ